MKYLYTDLYADFTCVGGACPDTCCIGWDVLVDKNTYDSYAALEEPLKSKICERIETAGTDEQKIYKIQMQKDGRCPFLNEQNLCNIYIDCSPDMMCNICKTYPRKLAVYCDTVMVTVMTSCPELVRMLLRKKEPMFFGFKEDSAAADTESADWTLYNELINGLVLTTDILQDRRFSFFVLLYLIMSLTYSIQRHIKARELTALRANTDCYRDVEYRRSQSEKLRRQNMKGAWNVIYSLFEQIEQWTARIPQNRHQLIDYKIIGKQEEEKYQGWLENYRRIEKETEYENLAVEFVFEYYMEALAGKNLFTGIVKTALLLTMIRSSEIVEYNQRGSLEEEDKVLLISSVSRLIEHTSILDMIVDQMIQHNEMESLFQWAYLFR